MLLVQVSVFGDGTSAAKNVYGDDVLKDYDELAKIGLNAAVPTDIKSSFDFLHDKIAA